MPQLHHHQLAQHFFLFVSSSPPFTLYALHTSGPRLSIIAASVLILLGNWIRYGGTCAHNPSFGVTMFGQILIGAQPFVLSDTLF
jgi:urocanate hydratase